jgi:hypothetical protein
MDWVQVWPAPTEQHLPGKNSPGEHDHHGKESSLVYDATHLRQDRQTGWSRLEILATLMACRYNAKLEPRMEQAGSRDGGHLLISAYNSSALLATLSWRGRLYAHPCRGAWRRSIQNVDGAI